MEPFHGARRSCLCAVLALSALVPGAHAASDTRSPADLAAALAADPASITGASLPVIPSIGMPTGVGAAYGSNTLPRDGSTFAIMSNGSAIMPADPGNDLNSAARSAYDVTILRLDLAVPAPANCLAFEFDFFTNDFTAMSPAFADTFLAELDPSAPWAAPSGATITAPDNFALSGGKFVTYESATGAPAAGFNGVPVATNAQGTGYAGALGWATAMTPVTAGAHALELSILDRGDHIVDSVALIDNLRFFRRIDGKCTRGITTDNDFAAPAVTMTTPDNGTATENPTPTLGGAAGTAPGDESGVRVDIYSGTSATGSAVQTLIAAYAGGLWEATAGTLSPGTYTAQAVQLDGQGNIGTSEARTFTIVAVAQTPPPSAAAISSALATAVAQAAKALATTTIGALVKKGFTAKNVEALAPGQLVLTLTASAPPRSGRAAAKVTLAKGSRLVATAGRYAVKLKVTAKGKRRLRRVRKVKGTLTITFRPLSGKSTARSRAVTLRR